MLVNKNILP